MKSIERVVLVILTLALAVSAGLTQTLKQKQTEIKPAAKQQSVAPAAASNPVTGSGTPGRLARWAGVSGSSTFVIGDSNITEDKFGKIGIGTQTPTSLLTVQGMVETTLGGYKFPDGTVQTTAGLASVFHNATLTGNGTAASPLGVAVPLELTGSAVGVNSILRVTNTGSSGTGMIGVGGPGSGTGVFGAGGNSSSGIGGIGVRAAGGNTEGSFGGEGIRADGGSTTSGTFAGGNGVLALGGPNLNNGSGGPGGPGVTAI